MHITFLVCTKRSAELSSDQEVKAQTVGKAGRVTMECNYFCDSLCSCGMAM